MNAGLVCEGIPSSGIEVIKVNIAMEKVMMKWIKIAYLLYLYKAKNIATLMATVQR